MSIRNNLPLTPRHRFSNTPTLELTAEQLDVRDQIAGRIDSGIYRLEYQCCCICGAVEGELISERERYGLVNSTVICRDCGLLRTDPVLRQQDYADFYLNSYRSLYFEGKYASDEVFEVQKHHGDTIIRFLNTCISLPKGSLVLDVGCGAGGMVQTFVDHGYRGIGIDYDRNYLQKGLEHGLDLREGNIASFQNIEKPRLITYSHVLEHVHDPNADLQSTREQLHDDGYLYVELPGIKRELRTVYKADLVRFFHIAHLYHFTLKTLTNLLQRNGFEFVAGNENIQSVWKKGEVKTDITSNYPSIRTYLVQTERFRRPLALKAFLNLRGLRTAGFFLRKVRLYSAARRIYRTLLKK